MKLKSLVKTCFAVPAQWEGETEDGREVYVRYRYGQLKAYVGDPDLKDPYWEMGEKIINRQIGDDLDGLMDTPEMLRRTGLEYDGDISDMDEIEVIEDYQDQQDLIDFLEEKNRLEEK